MRSNLVSAAATAAGLLLLSLAQSASAAYIEEVSATPFDSTDSVTFDGTAATQSDLGWDVTYVDHSDFTEPYFADDLNSEAYFDVPQSYAPQFTTYGGTNSPGEATNTPWIYVGFDNGYEVTAGEPALFDIWLGTDGPAEIDATLADNSATLTPVDFDVPTLFQILVESDSSQEVIFSAPADGDSVESGLLAISATATVPEPASIGLLAVTTAALLGRTRRRST